MDKKVIIGLIAVIGVGVAVYYFKTKKSEVPTVSDTKVDEILPPTQQELAVKFNEQDRINAIEQSQRQHIGRSGNSSMSMGIIDEEQSGRRQYQPL